MDRVYSSSMLTLVTYNIESGANVSGGYHQYLKSLLARSPDVLPRLAQFFIKRSVDIAMLTEVDAGSRRSKGVNQLDTICRIAEFPHSKFFPTMQNGDRINQGNGILSKYPIISHESHRLPGSGEPRYLSRATCLIKTIPNEEVDVYVTHLSLSTHHRLEQIKEIGKILASSQKPSVLAGDFNIRHVNELYPLRDVGFYSFDEHDTFPSWNPKRKLDAILVNSGISIHRTYVDHEYRESDHLPLVAECEIVGSTFCE